MKNRTLFKQEYIDAAMRASNFDNNKYKIFKMIYNIFGLLFGMGCIRYLIFQIMGSEEADWFMVIFVWIGCSSIPVYRNDWNGQKQ